MKLKHDKLLSNFAFNCNLRPYILAPTLPTRSALNAHKRLKQINGASQITLGGAVQVDQVDPAWFQRLKVKYNQLLSNFAFNFHLRPSN